MTLPEDDQEEQQLQSPPASKEWVMDNEQGLEEALSWDEFEQAVERFIAADGPGTDDLPADEFFALWARFEAERCQRVVEVERKTEDRG